MAHSKVRWISTPAFLTCIGGSHGRGEGVNVHEGVRTAEVEARTAEEGGGGGAYILGGRICPSTSRMRPSDKRMCPTVFRMRLFHRRMRPSANVCALLTGVCASSIGVCAPPPTYVPF
jgi:hypothetical protein